MMTEESIDLSSIDLDSDRRAALTEAIMAGGRPILARYAGARGPLGVLAEWLRPALAAAAVVAGIALGALAYLETRAAPASTATTSEALGLPGPWVAWIETGKSPSLEALVVSLEEDSR